VGRALVMTPIVRRPSGSTWRAILMASLAARSELPGVTARMRQLSRRMYDRIISQMRACDAFAAVRERVQKAVRDSETQPHLNVDGLVANRHARDAGQVHERHGEHIRAADFEADLLLGNGLVGARLAVSLGLNLRPETRSYASDHSACQAVSPCGRGAPNGFKIGEHLSRAVQELSPLQRPARLRRRVH